MWPADNVCFCFLGFFKSKHRWGSLSRKVRVHWTLHANSRTLEWELEMGEEVPHIDSSRAWEPSRGLQLLLFDVELT